jgi:fructosamine-3-kinase
MSLPAQLVSAIETGLGKITAVSAVGGGDISSAARLDLSEAGHVLVKWRLGPPTGLFTAERRGLELLRTPGALRVPRILAQSEATAGCPAYIALEWLGRGQSTDGIAEILGRGLAALHRHSASDFGLDHDNFIGANPQLNQPDEDWLVFYRDRRLRFQIETAGQNGYLPGPRAKKLEKLLGRLDSWLPSNPPVSLLHGDLWGGNWLVTDDGQPALIDPAVYFGHREADLAFTELFGGFPAVFYAAYNESWPLEQAYGDRKELYNLYHLLNHLNLFGEMYGSRVDSILRRYVG